MNEKDKLAWERACDALYGFGYSEQFSMALWQAALEYARQPAQAVAVDNCMRSHPHENMSLTCQLKTEIERLKKERNVYKEECEKAVAKYNRLFFKNISNVFLDFPASAAGSPHPDDEAVDKFAAAMKEKLALARDKGRCGWEHCDPANLSAMLYHHVEKGDPRDVANFCMFLWSLGQPITPCHKAPAVAQEPVAWAESDEHGEIAWGEEGGFSNDPAWIENPIALYKEAPAVAVNEQMLDVLKFIQRGMERNHIKAKPFLDFSNPNAESLELQHPLTLVNAAIAAAEKAKGGV